MTNVKKLNTPMICSICHNPIPVEPISGWAGGCNAQPINEGRCCRHCDETVVIPTRLALIYRRGRD
jgi:hypothetical protein